MTHFSLHERTTHPAECLGLDLFASEVAAP